MNPTSPSGPSISPQFVNAPPVHQNKPQKPIITLTPTNRPPQTNANAVTGSVPAQAHNPVDKQVQLCAVTSTDQVSAPKASEASFASIKKDTVDQFNALCEVGKNSSDSRVGRKDRTTSEQRAELRALRRNESTPGTRVSKAAPQAYAAAKGQRANSSMEDLLPPNEGLRQKINPFSGAFRDPATGLYVELKKLPDKNGKPCYAMCITGTGRGKAIRAQLATNLLNFVGVGGIPRSYQQAATLAAALQKKIIAEGGELCLVGHSLGGGIANYAGLKTNLNTTCFNPAALGAACLADLEKTGCLGKDREDKQKIIRTNGDPVSSKAAQKALIAFISISTYFYVRLPCSIGQVYEVPQDKSSALRSPIATHRLLSFNPAYADTESTNSLPRVIHSSLNRAPEHEHAKSTQ